MTTQLKPKHQLLVLKCYPRLPKNSAADIQPNSSELAYLTYYASSRTSKLPKVGAFLERKTAKDVYKAQSARVLVTLQILTALLNIKSLESPGGFPLIAPHVLRILIDILNNTTDISLIEATQTTWSAFCAHQAQVILAADHSYQNLYIFHPPHSLLPHMTRLTLTTGTSKLSHTTHTSHKKEDPRSSASPRSRLLPTMPSASVRPDFEPSKASLPQPPNPSSPSPSHRSSATFATTTPSTSPTCAPPRSVPPTPRRRRLRARPSMRISWQKKELEGLRLLV